MGSGGWLPSDAEAFISSADEAVSRARQNASWIAPPGDNKPGDFEYVKIA